MTCFVGLGSNVGDRQQNLEAAARRLFELTGPSCFRVSPLYETKALLPERAPAGWNTPYLNAVVQLAWKASPRDLLETLQELETEAGRGPAPRWAPRILDLDLLLFGDEVLREDSLVVPHREICQRSFVLDPLKDLAPSKVIPGCSESVILQARRLSTHTPLVMGIVNLTPDSFSDGGETADLSSLEIKLRKMLESRVPVLDLGAESTRPGALSLRVEEEWRRLEPALKLLRALLRGRLFRPRISVDTRHALIAERALEYGIDCINDVSGKADPRMGEVLRQSSCEYVLMHSLTVPADPRVCLPAEDDPVKVLKEWLGARLNDLESEGVEQDRVLFDPGLGFGKTASQSVNLLNRMEEFSEIPVRLLVGHSRKSFLKTLAEENPRQRDPATLQWSLKLSRKGVDVLRVHDFESHQRSLIS